MITGLEILLLVLVLAFFLGAATIIRAVKPFIVNAVVGLLAILVAQTVFGVSVGVTPVAFVVVALGGFPGALLVLLLSVFGIAFVP